MKEECTPRQSKRKTDLLFPTCNKTACVFPQNGDRSRFRSWPSGVHASFFHCPHLEHAEIVYVDGKPIFISRRHATPYSLAITFNTESLDDKAIKAAFLEECAHQLAIFSRYSLTGQYEKTQYLLKMSAGPSSAHRQHLYISQLSQGKHLGCLNKYLNIFIIIQSCISQTSVWSLKCTTWTVWWSVEACTMPMMPPKHL